MNTPGIDSRNSWSEVEELLIRLEPLPEDQRQALLDRECRGNATLRQRVERLLAEDSAAGDPIGRIVERAVAEHGEGATEERIGAFRLLGLLGEGGMGQVFAAERVDGELYQQVAIKRLKTGFDRGEAEARFRQERQVLAQLDHPGIARLLDGGSTPDGQPYLVMERIEGIPIDEYCDRSGLSIDARLDLFSKVCEAVHHAHGHLVVHRDIKPSNILVTEAGEPKLLDFGIAKLLDEHVRIAGAASPATRLGTRVMTPEYASPEQVRDEPISTATDVYALGLLLYRLLTGARPYPLESPSREELRRAICETEAEKPSDRVRRLPEDERTRGAGTRGLSPSAWPRRLSGDLDAILLEALRKEPKHRYSSVEQLMADLRRHRSGLPVAARRGGWRYRTGRFLRRHGKLAAAVLSTMLALSVGLFGQVQEARRASQEAAASAQVIDYLVEVFGASDPFESRQVVSVQDLLERGVAGVETRLDGQPLVQARLLGTLGRIYHNRGWFEGADPLFRGSLERWQGLLGETDPALAKGHLDLADNLRVLGRSEEALPHYKQALRGRLRVFGETSLEVAEVRNNLALAQIRLGNLDEGERLLARALAQRRETLGQDHYLVAQGLHNQTLIALELGEPRKAYELGHQTLEVKRKILDPAHPSTGRTLFMIAEPARELGHFREAEALLLEALEMLRGAWGDSHRDVLGTRTELAFVRHLLGEAALEEQEEILAAKVEHQGADSGSVAYTLALLARQYEDLGRREAAEGALRRALEIRRSRLGEEHPKTASGLHALGAFLLRTGELDEAAEMLGKATPLLREALPPRHPTLGEALLDLAELRYRQARPREAEPPAREGAALLEARLPEGHPLRERAGRLLAELEEGGDPVRQLETSSPDRRGGAAGSAG